MLMTVKWEISALKRTGGYNVKENNLFHPDQVEKEGEKEDKTQPDESYRYSIFHPSTFFKYRQMCKIHSVSCRAGFVDTVNNLSLIILNSVAEYKQTFTFDKLIQGAITKKFASGEEILAVHQDIA